MAVVRLRGTLGKLADGGAEHRVRAPTVAELLLELEQANPGLRGWILDERGHIRRHINVFVNGEHGDRNTPVTDADRIEVLPAISGG